LHHGVLAPHARWRPQVVFYGRPARDSHAREFEAIATVQDPLAIQTLRAHLGRSLSTEAPGPARPPRRRAGRVAARL